MANLPIEFVSLPIPWELQSDGARIRTGDTEWVGVGDGWRRHECIFQQIGKSVAIGIDFIKNLLMLI